MLLECKVSRRLKEASYRVIASTSTCVVIVWATFVVSPWRSSIESLYVVFFFSIPSCFFFHISPFPRCARRRALVLSEYQVGMDMDRFCTSCTNTYTFVCVCVCVCVRRMFYSRSHLLMDGGECDACKSCK